MSGRDEQKEGLFIKTGISHIQGGLIREIGFDGFTVLSVIASFANSEGEAFPSQQLIADICGVERKTINRKINKLCKARFNGKPILEKKTVRKGYERTKTFYRILPAAGIAFGNGKVVPIEGQRSESDSDSAKDVVPNRGQANKNVVPKQVQAIEEKGNEFGECQINSDVVPNRGNDVVPNQGEGCPRNGTLTKSINENHKNEIQIEQENNNRPIFDNHSNFVEKINKENKYNANNANKAIKAIDSANESQPLPNIHHNFVEKENENIKRKDKEGDGDGAAVTSSESKSEDVEIIPIEEGEAAEAISEFEAFLEQMKKGTWRT